MMCSEYWARISMKSGSSAERQKMFANLGLGTLLIATTVLIHTVGLLLLSAVMRQVVEWWRLHRHGMGQTAAMVTTVLGLFLLHTIEVWVWAGAYLWLGAIGMLEEALYFSTVTFSTIGFGDFHARAGMAAAVVARRG